MKRAVKIAIVVFAVCIVSASAFVAAGPANSPLVRKASTTPYAVLSILFDDHYFGQGLKTGHGFACLIETKDRTILFDTGGRGGLLLGNFKRMNKNPQAVQTIVISHEHEDHTGGLAAVLDLGIKPNIYIPAPLPFDRIVRGKSADLVRVGSGPVEIARGVYSTGTMSGEGGEQAILINTPGGVTVVTGCSHPGITGIIERAKAVLNRPIYLVMGGFHLLYEDDSALTALAAEFKKLGVERVAPCHCSGRPEAFRRAYKDHFIEAGVGKVIRVE
jgi:7,8-dihydropterin-6-yl-methyl-4-(beta-D-ribofuranosyl)aminobenzene 5'-phosphate synthase